MSIEDIKRVAIKKNIGETLQIRYPNGEVDIIPLLPQDFPEKNYNCNGTAICFFSDYTMYILPYHRQDYAEILEEAGYEKNENVYVPFSDGLSYPEDYQELWSSLMEKSRATV